MRPERVFLVMLFTAAAAAAVPGCAGSPRMNDPQSSSSTVVAIPGRSQGNDRRDRRRGETETQRNNSDVLVELGQRYFARGEYEIALDKLRSAIEIDPRSANAHTVIAILYETIDDSTKAAEHYQRSVQYGGRNGDVLNNYGSWLCRQRKYDEADETFRKALADPFYKTPESALANAGTCALAAGRVEPAENYLRQVLTARPEDGQALLGLAEIAVGKDEYMRARAFLQRAEAQAPLTRSALELAIKIEESLGDPRSAAAYRARLNESDGS